MLILRLWRATSPRLSSVAAPLVIAALLPCLTAGLATFGLAEAFLGEELLILRAVEELAPAVGAN
jgi:hypothetical protein